MPAAVFVSPHLDDAAFSAGATAAKLARAGWDVTVLTVFTRSVPNPTGFALACQTDKGLPPTADYMAIRRAEDRAAADVLGAAAVHLDLPEAPHRGYTSAADLFAGVHPDDTAVPGAVAEAAAPFLDADLVLYPLGLGNHVDHLHVIAAVEAHVPADRRAAWFDTPYHLKLDTPPAGQPVTPIPSETARKLDACAAYATQLPFQFGGEPVMRAALRGVSEFFASPVPARA